MPSSISTPTPPWRTRPSSRTLSAGRKSVSFVVDDGNLQMRVANAQVRKLVLFLVPELFDWGRKGGPRWKLWWKLLSTACFEITYLTRTTKFCLCNSQRFKNCFYIIKIHWLYIWNSLCYFLWSGGQNGIVFKKKKGFIAYGHSFPYHLSLTFKIHYLTWSVKN